MTAIAKSNHIHKALTRAASRSASERSVPLLNTAKLTLKNTSHHIKSSHQNHTHKTLTRAASRSASEGSVPLLNTAKLTLKSTSHHIKIITLKSYTQCTHSRGIAVRIGRLCALAAHGEGSVGVRGHNAAVVDVGGGH